MVSVRDPATTTQRMQEITVTQPDHAFGARIAGAVLVVVSLLSALVKAHHPVAGASKIADVAVDISSQAGMDRAVDAILIAMLGALMLAHIEISCYLDLRRSLVRCALVCYAISVGAMFGEPMIDGLVLS